MAASVATTATTLEGQALEIAREMQVLESDQGAENRVAINTDIENGQATITIVLPVSLGGDGGALELTAGSYLA
ncbi:MAG: hypothetical protein F6K19_50230 [Cyanothece sp. SIO1E1]|nr:hypothetical protein [Cyanothece sp. SIO1E1]